LLFSKLPYDPAKDIAAVTQLITQPSAIAVNTDMHVNTIAELIALLKKNPGKYNFASIGTGSLSHLAMEALAQKSGTRIVHIPYPSSPAAMTAVVRGDAQMAAMPAVSVKAQVAGGKVKMLAVSTAKRSPYLPDVPTLKESGIDVEADAWMGMIAPGGVPPAMVEKINKAVVEALQDPAIKEKLATQLMEPVGNSPAEFRAKIDAEIGRWAPVIKAAGIKPVN
jgi:tripartite-type tricarboxylate transporter receptor subunit TctC